MRKKTSLFILTATLAVMSITTVFAWKGGYQAWGSTWLFPNGRECNSYLEVWDQSASYMWVQATMNDISNSNMARNKTNYTLRASRFSGYTQTCYAEHWIEMD